MMNKKAKKAIVIIIVIAMLLSSFSFVLFLTPVHGAERANLSETTGSAQESNRLTAQELQLLRERLSDLERYIRVIHENYKDEVELRTLVDGAFEGAINSLGDPFSNFFADVEEGQDFIESVTGEFVGIGVVISTNADGFCRVDEVFVRGPAERAGIRPGDLIFRIDGEDVTERSISEISSMLRGEEGTRVSVTVQRDGVQRTFTVTRETVSRTTIDYEMLEGSVGYIVIKSFADRTTREFREARANLVREGATSLIIDLRNNAGGFVQVAVNIADELISDGYIMHYVQRGRVIHTHSASGRSVTPLETIVLVNEFSASASEILAGALQDNNVAELVGTTTFGKGAAQMPIHTSERQLSMLSMFYFVTPDKNEIHGVGITPDHVVRNGLGEYRAYAMAIFEMFAPFAEDARPAPGDTGLNVFAAQQRLMLLGYDVSITAQMDEATVEAIKRFQREQGLWPGGVLDFTTQRRINEVTLAYISNESEEDLQLLKAIELLR